RITRPIESAREHQHPKSAFDNRIFVRAEVGRGGTDNLIALVLEQCLMPGHEGGEALNRTAPAERLQHCRCRYALWKLLKSTEHAGSNQVFIRVQSVEYCLNHTPIRQGCQQ